VYSILDSNLGSFKLYKSRTIETKEMLTKDKIANEISDPITLVCTFSFFIYSFTSYPNKSKDKKMFLIIFKILI